MLCVTSKTSCAAASRIRAWNLREEGGAAAAAERKGLVPGAAQTFASGAAGVAVGLLDGCVVLCDAEPRSDSTDGCELCIGIKRRNYNNNDEKR